MAGSYNDIVNNDGSLKSDMVIDLMFEDGDYVVETIKELYGMIWYLAYVLKYLMYMEMLKMLSKKLVHSIKKD